VTATIGVGMTADRTRRRSRKPGGENTTAKRLIDDQGAKRIIRLQPSKCALPKAPSKRSPVRD